MATAVEAQRRQEREREAVPFNAQQFIERQLHPALERWAEQDLPVAQKRETVLEGIRLHDRILLEASPGSGKSTSAPVLALEAVLQDNADARVAITQPRRLATQSVAEYVGSQIGSDYVDYRFRDHPIRKEDARLHFTVEESLLNDLIADPMLQSYDAVMVDEVHERSITIDILVPLLKRAQELRAQQGKRQLKVILASATLDAQTLSDYFVGAHRIEVEGRAFPVSEHFAESPITPEQLPTKAAEKTRQLLDAGKEGDILIFMPGRGEIDRTEEALGQVLGESDNTEIIKITGGDSRENPYDKIQQRAQGKRHIYIATDAAETSITIPDITAVIDAGLMKRMVYDPDTRLTTLETLPHTKANWQQRKGRAGRVQAGDAYALFTRGELADRSEHQVAEFLRSDLTPQVLRMKAAGIEDVMHFDYIEHPGKETIEQAMKSLQLLGALDEQGQITEIGRIMAEIDEDPHFARMLIEGQRRNCVDGVLVAIGLMKAKDSPFAFDGRKKDAFGRKEDFQRKYGRFIHPQSDFLTFLRVWNEYVGVEDKAAWAKENGLKGNVLWEIRRTRGDLLRDVFSTKLPPQVVDIDNQQAQENLYLAIASGLMDRTLTMNRAAIKTPTITYSMNTDALGNIRIDAASVFGKSMSSPLIAGKIRSSRGASSRNVVSFASALMPYHERLLVEAFPYLPHSETSSQQAHGESQNQSARDENAVRQELASQYSPTSASLPISDIRAEEQQPQTWLGKVSFFFKNLGSRIRRFFLGK